MALNSYFIGINKYLDSQIFDLSGASNDAKALWALFTDTIPDIQAHLFVDEQANVESVKNVFESVLSKASVDDSVIITFAGHGTPDHRLVCYNTIKDDCPSTSISAEEIANYFRKSKAKTIILILDCCFSGGAPARVLSDVSLPRNTCYTMQSIAGEGRVIIAASNYNEPAWEQPASGHGLLTKALIDILQDGNDNIDFMSATSEILKHVAAEAQRIGQVQTPVVLGSITGGLFIPVLKPGENYKALFPDIAATKISENIAELTKFGVPSEVTDVWADRFKHGLNDLQQNAVNEYRVLNGESLLVVAPTSSGKTFIGEMASMCAHIQGRKTVFLFPYRALTNEKYEQFSALYGASLDLRIIRCTGDHTDQTRPFVSGKYEIALLTYEMFLNIVVSNPWVLNQIGLVVIDEAQFIADSQRGITVELLITYLLSAREKGISPQIIALSAVIGGTNSFESWLDCKLLITNERPVPLLEGVMDRSGLFQYIDTAGESKLEQLIPNVRIHQRKRKPSSQDMIVPLVQEILKDQNEKVIIFRNQRGTAEGVAKYLASELNQPSIISALEALPNNDISTTSSSLRMCLEKGTAFHNTNLNREEKAIVENEFRNPNSSLSILAATTTVAAGINTPASTVIITELFFLGSEKKEFTVAEYKNMAGRAGRVGFQETGRAIVLADTSHERVRLFNKYVTGNLESIASSFNYNHIDTWIVRLLAQIERIPRGEVGRLLSNTYGGYLANKHNPIWRDSIKKNLEDLLSKLISLGLVEEEGDYVQLTLLGRVCGRSALSFNSAIRLVEILKDLNIDNLSAEELMAIIQVLPEFDDIYTPIMRKGTAENVRVREATARYRDEIVRILQKYVPNQFEYFARCKRVSILWDWIHGVPIDTIENQYTPNPYLGKIGYGDIRKIADITRFHLKPAFDIVSIIFLGRGPDEEAVDALLKQLEVGLPSNALNLLGLPISLERGDYLKLVSTGIKSLEIFWDSPAEQLENILGESKYKSILTQKPINEDVTA